MKSTGRGFQYKNKEDFTGLDDSKKAYYLARLYIRQDTGKSSLPYKSRLFMCVNYIKKQPREIMSVLYNYLTDNTHDSLPLWKVLPKAVLYDQQIRRQNNNKQVYAQYSEGMLDEILGDDKKGGQD